jgi:hypothetical protein
MSFLAEQLPSASEIIELPVDELALRLLQLMAVHEQGNLLNRNNIGLAGIWGQELARSDRI